MKLEYRARLLWYQIFGFPKEIPMTDAAVAVLTKHTEEMAERLIETSHRLAKREGHPDTVTGHNVVCASKILELEEKLLK